MDRMQLLTSRYGKKGFVVSIDVMIAIFLLVSVLATITFFSSANDSYVVDYSMLRVGGDITKILIKNDALDATSVEINNSIYTLLPDNYDMRLKIDCNSAGQMYAGKELPLDTDIMSNMLAYVNDDGTSITDECVVQYFIWIRD